uniref:Ionotropic glutamate receptor C-terminal domain-containing protein n=1 Tax=Anopheles culicifacies TaxID=139723 RepID=A0A182MKM5_9DIPT
MCKVSLALWLLLPVTLIFTPLTQSSAFRRYDHANTHAHRLTHQTGIEFWVQLIVYVDCPHVVLLDSFGFFANRPTLAWQLFVRLTAVGVRVSVRRHLRAGERIPLATHRLAIIVPIVMKPSKVVGTDQLENLFGQIAHESHFDEFYRWMFLFVTAHEQSVLYALHRLPIQADSNVWCVSVGTHPFDHPIHLERKMMPIDRFVRRMQMMIPAHPETEPNRTVATLTLPSRHTSGSVSVWQLYRLETRTNTIDVVVELLETNDMGRMVLHQALTPELRNDFFGQTELLIMVYTSTARHINSTYVAQSMPLFRNARINIESYKLRSRQKKIDFHYQLIITNKFNKRLQGWFAYSLPIFHEHLSLYIHQADVGYNERSSKILVIILLPIFILGTLLCLSLQLALNVTNTRRGRNTPNRPTVSFADAFVWLVGVFAQQGSSIRPNATSSMIIILAALFFSSIMYCTYLTKITSQLSVDVQVDYDLEALLKAKQYRIGFVGNFTTNQTVIRKRYDPVMNEVMQQMQRDKSLYVSSHEDGLNRVLSSRYVLIGNTGTVRLAMQNLNQDQYCNASIVID